MRCDTRAPAIRGGCAPRQLLASALCALSVAAAPLPAWAEAVPENELKAAFVFNFAVFTEWPQEVLPSGAPLCLCADAAGPLFAALAQLNDKVVNGHRIALRAAGAGAGTPTGAGARSCHVLVLERAARERWSQLRRDPATANVLTVADDGAGVGVPADHAGGAIISMSVDGKRIGFDVDMGAARTARLTLSSKLLRLARSVQWSP